MLLRHALGRVLRRARLDRGLSLRQLAELSRVSVPYLSEIERGRKEVSSEILAAVAKVLDLSMSRVVDDASRELEKPVVVLESATSAPLPQRIDGPVLLAA